MTITMNMSSYVIEEAVSVDKEYGDEVMCAGWNPQLSVALQQHTPDLMDKHAALPASLANVDIETFLQKIYAYQC